MRIFASFNSHENGPVVMEDSVPVSEVRVELHESNMPHVKSGVCFISSYSDAPVHTDPLGL